MRMSTNIKRTLALFAAIVGIFAGLCALTACGSGDAQAIKGEWQVQGTNVTVVFTDDKFKMVGNEYDYSVDSNAKTITYTSGAMQGVANYTLGEGGKQLTLVENDGAKTTVFDKVSDDTSAEPSAGEDPGTEG